LLGIILGATYHIFTQGFPGPDLWRVVRWMSQRLLRRVVAGIFVSRFKGRSIQNR